MPTTTAYTNPSQEGLTITKRIVDSERGENIDITRTEITSVDGSTPGSQPSWASFTVRPQRFSDGREEVPVDLVVSPIGLRSNSIEKFEFEVEYTDRKTTAAETFTVWVDDLTSSGRQRLSWAHLDGMDILASDVTAPTGPYKIANYPKPGGSVVIGSEDDRDGLWTYHMNGGVEIDWEAGYAFVKQLQDAEGSYPERVRVLRIDLSDGSRKQVTPSRGVKAFDIDRQNKNIYWAWPDDQDWSPPNQGGQSGSGIYRRNYDGSGQIYKSFTVGFDYLKKTVLDMDIDPLSDTMVLVGYRFPPSEPYEPPYAACILKTSISNPANDVEADVRWQGPENSNDKEKLSPGLVHSVDVDWENGYVFTTEAKGGELVQRRLSDLVVEQRHSLTVTSLASYGIAANPEQKRVYLSSPQGLEKNRVWVTSYPYSDFTNETVEYKGVAHFPVLSRTEFTNASPIWEERPPAEWRS